MLFLLLAFGVELALMFGVPVGLWLYLRRRYGVAWGLIGAGALTFVLSQVVHLPLNWALGLLGGGRGVALWPLPAMAAVAGLSAGVCEEIARYLVLRYWRKEARTWAQGLAFGAGHGGIESILLGSMVGLTLINMLVLRYLPPERLGLPAETLATVRQQVEAFWGMAWYIPLLGGVERLAALALHLAWSLMVLRAVRTLAWGWLLGAILGHAAVDAVAVGLAQSGVSPLLIEGILVVLALGALAWVRLQRDPLEAGPEPTPA